MSVFATIGTEPCLQHGFASSDMAEEYAALANEGWHVKDQVGFSPMQHPLPADLAKQVLGHDAQEQVFQCLSNRSS